MQGVFIGFDGNGHATAVSSPQTWIAALRDSLAIAPLAGPFQGRAGADGPYDRDLAA